MKTRAIAIAVGLAAIGASCRESGSGAVWAVESNASGLDMRRARVTPEDAVAALRRIGEGRIEIALRPGYRGAVRVEVPGACPLGASFEGGAARARTDTVQPRFLVPAWMPDAGFDRDVEIAATATCAGAAESVGWRVVTGDAKLTLAPLGRSVRFHTRSLADAIAAHGPAFPSWGVVPISARAQGAIELEASYEDQGMTVRQRVRAAPAVRATGIPTVAVASRVYLFGEGWTAAPDARGKTPTLAAANGFTSVVSEDPGRFMLTDARGQHLALRIGRHDELPLDCARSDCHADIGRTAQDSAMTHVLERGLSGAFGEAFDPRCALACHAVGEPGGRDGGFVHLATILGARVPSAPSPAWFADLPRPLRRAAGVGCTACHGPAAIPEPSARWFAIRADVCATCHDAPPKYAHVQAWQTSRMAASDRAPETRTGECASCHTTAGFLVRLGVRKPDFAPPPEAGAIGVACAACHTPHARDPQRSLVRTVARPAWVALDVGPSGVCIACHGGDGASDTGLPRASAARILFGGDAPSPHATRDGCLLCHVVASDRASDVHGTGHAFKAQPAACKPCHADPPVERAGAGGKNVAARAAELWDALARRGVVRRAPTGPAHASGRYTATDGVPPKLADAARDVALVLEDPAAGAHDAKRARALLDAAEAALAAAR